jgi:hypothetical protein
MSEPQGPDQQWSPGEPAQQPPGSEEGTAQVGWQEPAYAPTQYAQPQPYPGPPQFPQGQEFGQQPTQYAQPGQPGQPGQYQPPQYGQQFSPTEGYGQPGQCTPPCAQYGEGPSWPAAGAAEGSRSSVKTLGLIGGVVAAIVIAVVLVLCFWWPGWAVTTKLDHNAAQRDVGKILTDQTNGYAVKSADNINCNNGQDPEVKKGTHFTCDVSVDGQHKQVTVTFLDNNGTYEVGRPK